MDTSQAGRVGWWYDPDAGAEGVIIPQTSIHYPFDCHSADYGSGIFAGIRAYPLHPKSELYDDDPAASRRTVFRFVDHIERLRRSAEACLMEPEFSWEDFEAACLEVFARNLDDNYLRPSIFRGPGLGVNPERLKVLARVISRNLLQYFTDHLVNGGITLTSRGRYRRAHCGLAYRPKCGSDYGYAGIWKALAVAAGFTEPLVFDPEGQNVSECSAANLFARFGEQLFTPDPTSAACLDGITRRTVKEIVEEEFALKVIESPIPYSILIEADEVFATGSAAEVIPVTKIDDHLIGKPILRLSSRKAGYPGEITRELQVYLRQLWGGLIPAYHHMLTKVPNSLALSSH